MLPTLSEIKDELNIEDTTDDARLLELLAAAVEVVEHDVRPEFVPLSLRAGPAMRVALIEFVRDMWASGGARGVQSDNDTEPVYGLGRPLIPPYVRGLLRPYVKREGTPQFSFPTTELWPSW